MAHLTQPQSIFELRILASHFACTKPDVKMNEKNVLKNLTKLQIVFAFSKKDFCWIMVPSSRKKYLANRTTPETHQLMHYFSMFVPLWHI